MTTGLLASASCSVIAAIELPVRDWRAGTAVLKTSGSARHSLFKQLDQVYGRETMTPLNSDHWPQH